MAKRRRSTGSGNHTVDRLLAGGLENFNDFAHGDYPNGGRTMYRILLVDLSARELAQRNELRNRKAQLDGLEKTAMTSGGLSDEQKKEREDLVKELKKDVAVDPFYRAVASAYDQRPWDEMKDHILKYGLMGSQQVEPVQAGLGPKEQEIAGICGLLQLDNAIDVDQPRYTRRIAEAQGEYRDNRDLFDAAFKRLGSKYIVKLQSQIEKKLVDSSIIGCIRPDQSIKSRSALSGTKEERQVPRGADLVAALSARNVAAVVRRLADDNVTADDPWLVSRIDSTYDMQTGVVNGAPPSALEIMLPDLDNDADVQIVAQNLHAVQGLHFAYMLEEAGMFRVIDRIVDLFRQGLLPLGRGKAGDFLYQHFKKSSERITESERREMYMRAFGAPGGDPNASLPNREFSELWLRFVSAVSSFSRQLTVEKLLRNAVPMAVSQEQVRKSGLDLAANLSLHGYGIAYFAATELQTNILQFRDVLSDPEVRQAFGARDMWQVIDQVNVNYLGGAKNSTRYRTLARSGAIIIRWLANNHDRLVNRSGTDVISPNAITSAQLRMLGSTNPMVEPTDWDLVQACEQCRVSDGMQDQSIEQYSQPSESPVTTSRPIDIPPAAREVLDSVGVNLPGM